MHEVINFACSHASGHLITQLYNVQESHLPYSQNKTLTHANDVFLAPRKVRGKTNYYPRSINVEFAGGYGFLGKYQYHESQVSPDSFENVVVDRQERHVKNQFQVNLDSGKPADASLLSKENTTYWTDYNKLIYRPESLLSLGEFSHPNGAHRNFPRLHFENFNIGEEAFKTQSDNIDDFFRKNLEQLDQIQGVSFFSELDNGWAGFTSEMMIFLRDEYFGNGVSSKYNLWTYGLMSPGKSLKKTDKLLTRIRALTDFAANSTMFMPISAPRTSNAFLSDEYDSSKLWHQGAVQSMFVNSLWGLNNQAQSTVSMATIENSLLRGNGSRNIVNEIRLKSRASPEKLGPEFGIISDVSIMDMYLNPDALKKLQDRDQGSGKDSSLDIGLNADSQDHVYARGLICPLAPEQGPSGSVTDVYVNPYMEEITKTETFPKILSKPEFEVEFSQTTALKPLLKEYRKTVERVRLSQHLDILGDKAEVVELLSTLIEEYTHGYSDESDFDD